MSLMKIGLDSFPACRFIIYYFVIVIANSPCRPPPKVKGRWAIHMGIRTSLAYWACKWKAYWAIHFKMNFHNCSVLLGRNLPIILKCPKGFQWLEWCICNIIEREREMCVCACVSIYLCIYLSTIVNGVWLLKKILWIKRKICQI